MGAVCGVAWAFAPAESLQAEQIVQRIRPGVVVS